MTEPSLFTAEFDFYADSLLEAEKQFEKAMGAFPQSEGAGLWRVEPPPVKFVKKGRRE